MRNGRLGNQDRGRATRIRFDLWPFDNETELFTTRDGLVATLSGLNIVIPPFISLVVVFPALNMPQQKLGLNSRKKQLPWGRDQLAETN